MGRRGGDPLPADRPALNHCEKRAQRNAELKAAGLNAEGQPRKPRGRKPLYDPDVHPHWAFILMVQGLTEAEAAAEMDVAYSTFNKWKVDYLEFTEALKRGGRSTNGKVAGSLLSRALGFQSEETKVVIDPNTKKPMRIERTTKNIAGDVQAQRYWLNNREPTLFRESQDITVAGGLDVNNDGDVLERLKDNPEAQEKAADFLQALSYGRGFREQDRAAAAADRLDAAGYAMAAAAAAGGAIPPGGFPNDEPELAYDTPEIPDDGAENENDFDTEREGEVNDAQQPGGEHSPGDHPVEQVDSTGNAGGVRVRDERWDVGITAAFDVTK